MSSIQYYIGSYPTTKETYFRYKQKQRAEEIGLPIPWTGTRRCPYGSTLRRPKTRQENRENCLEYDYDVKYKKRKMPTAWDDVPRSDWADKSWEKHHKTHWKR